MQNSTNFDLKWAREHAGLTQKEASEALGVTRETFSRWESGKYPIPAIKLSRFLRGVQVSRAEIPKQLVLPPTEEPEGEVEYSGDPIEAPWGGEPPPEWVKESRRRVIATTERNRVWNELNTFLVREIKNTEHWPALFATGYTQAKDAGGIFDPAKALKLCRQWWEDKKAEDINLPLA